MNQKIKFLLYYIFSVALLLFTVNFEAMAQETVTDGDLFSIRDTGSYERNVYESAYSIEELDQEIRDNLKNRELTFTIRFLNNQEYLKVGIKNIFDDYMCDDDYFHYTLEKYSYVYEGYEGDFKICFNVQYSESKEQTDYVTQRVDEILSKIITDDMNDFQKEKAIHDYIVLNVRYDTNFIERTAYAALTKGKVVCQGYSLLAYKMLNRAGIETRIIEGTANGSHLWNLVKLDGRWYHLDCTWDDPVPNQDGVISYKFFNLTDEQISVDHCWIKTYPQAV
jgi:transglutaminase-like putative cysteine protease